ncbi:hypothetical protein A2643_03135 [Candidatus Nomurabacteria bacterium RIFCSPHIGHO2_01_FULL_39_220]|uniref:Cyclic nucleotide-binding domain-containing protein n=1 Tax=Candidatus Nomurabacteria bacterium RIFCSPLOWO2_02_FULL_40_67 TaxID=1801787 RepID=A0A1F6Y678_9BACT|nr:MAG: hypothetical protein UU01_C0005G0047 [Parcubacteria group bacterium GW2011_GWA2_40_37]KKS71861.1 MAG: hypothetical protein UV43_C0026G0002 [Parcubacteria group bacterium GW2011_GWF2_42_7]OGI61604.1 MAG: hypothetical protein A2W12_03190 [Candidatus Nomurabacteria bacterium RBG_16_40_11]OGI70371.1 MAG: hypothetical protein A2643_03135 [Candidatus Nomurabacteria bacterium RIFCSPHIGHO2_01_FULL_39_220]OGI72511.1 MAG: hypothetical protein A2W56_01265 [Candidatus Nomurabacteria bacterium RIFCS
MKYIYITSTGSVTLEETENFTLEEAEEKYGKGELFGQIKGLGHSPNQIELDSKGIKFELNPKETWD